MTRKDFLVYGKPQITKEDADAVYNLMMDEKKWIGTGPKVAEFEETFKDHVGTKYAMALNSCTAGLHLAMVVSGLNPGDEVITSPMTFCASANTIIHAGGKPVFVDVEKDTFNIDPDKIEAAITDNTKAIILVHFGGRPCDMDKIMAIAKKHDLEVIEDCAHAIETQYKGQPAGSIGDMGVFSFYVTKNLVTGEGGMVTTNSEEYATKVKMYGLHGMSKDAWKRFSDEGYKHYEVVFPGFKYNMIDMQAALGLSQYKRLKKNHERREEIWNKYNEAFKDLPIIRPVDPEKDTIHAYHLYTILLDIDKVKMSRDDFLNALIKENIGTGVHYEALHLHPYYKDTFNLKRGDFPNAEFISDRTLSLPLSAALDDQAVSDVIAAMKKLLVKNK